MKNPTSTTELYDPTPDEAARLEYDPLTRTMRLNGKPVLDLRGIVLTTDPKKFPDGADTDYCVETWRILAKYDIRLARQLADQKRRRLYVAVCNYSSSVYMCHDGGRYYLATLPTEADAKAFAAELAAVYAAHRVPLCVDL